MGFRLRFILTPTLTFLGSTTLLGANILVILAELSLVLSVLYLLNWLASKQIEQLAKLWRFKLDRQTLKSLRRNIRSISILTGAVLCLLLVAANSWPMIYQGENLQEYTLALLGHLPAEFWLTLATGIAKSIGTISLAAFSIRPLHRTLDLASVRAQPWDDITANALPIEEWFGFLKKHLTNGIWLLAILACTQFLGLPVVVPQNLAIAIEKYGIVILWLLIVKAQKPIVDSLDPRGEKSASNEILLRLYRGVRFFPSVSAHHHESQARKAPPRRVPAPPDETSLRARVNFNSLCPTSAGF